VSIWIKEDATGEWRKLYKELHNLHSSPDIIKMKKSGRMKWARHAVSMGNMIIPKN
jgi:hypothetical protein